MHTGRCSVLQIDMGEPQDSFEDGCVALAFLCLVKEWEPCLY